MKTWEEVFCKAKEVASAAGRKAGDLADLAKMKIKIAENEKAIDVTMEAIGRLYYDSRKAETEPDAEAVQELVQQVDELTAANAELQASIDQNRGQRTCSGCGAGNTADAVYCNKCGKEL